jgi:hypothetical protein
MVLCVSDQALAQRSAAPRARSRGSKARSHARPAEQAWQLALLVALPLSAAYLVTSPSAGDLAAATYRSDLFAHAGLTAWDTGWYAAHGYWLPGYSLLSPALGAWLGVRVLLALSALAACLLFALIAERAFGRTAGSAAPRPRGVSGAGAAAIVFALGFCVGMLSGRVPYDLGFAIGLGAVLALIRGSIAPALALGLLCGAASPVAGAFLALAGLAVALSGGPSRRAADAGGRSDLELAGWRSGHGLTGRRSGLALAAAGLAPALVLNIAYPNGGYEPFASSAFWPALGGVLLLSLLLPQGPLAPAAWRSLRLAGMLYALALIAAYVLRTPMGGNAARLGPLLAAPLVVGVLWERRRVLLALLAPVLLYWQLVTPIRDYASIAGDPSVNASYYAPLLAELKTLGDRSRAAEASGRGRRSPKSAARAAHTIVEVPMTRAHWEAAYLAGAGGGRIELARGWERQLDTRYAALFYRPTLTASAYRGWLAENRVAYVALPDVPLDAAGRLEGALVARGLPYLRPIWHSLHWRLYRFIG